MMRHFFCFLAAVGSFVSLSFSQSIELEPITVKKSFDESLFQTTDYFSKYEIAQAPFNSLEEIVDYCSSINLKSRAPFGVQQDISLRGSTFEDNFVSLAGIDISDPQSGHFSLEIPLTSADLEEIEVFKDAQKLNFVPKKPKDKGVLLRSSFGQHALWEKLLSFNFPLKDVNNRISVEHKVSSGGRQDTDFDIYNFSCHSLLEDEFKELEFLFGATKRDFGADAFYVTSRPHEQEHITQRFFSLRSALLQENSKLDNTIYFRRHSDKYILDRHNKPLYTNYHTTYVYGSQTSFDFYDDLYLSFNIEREKVTSTNIDTHYRLRKGVAAGIKERRINDFIFDAGAGVDYYERWQYLEKAHLKAGYFLKDDLKLKFCFNRFWRPPSFTELYYNDGYSIGNDGLSVQKTNSFEWGLDYLTQDDLNLGGTLFLKDQHGTIDWCKNSSSAAYRARNVGNLKAYGVDLYAEKKFDAGYLRKLRVDYTYLDLAKDNPYNISKYVFDYSSHKAVSMAGLDFGGISLNLISNFLRPIERKEYVTFDMKLEKKISDFVLSLEGTNIFNNDYWEMKDIEGVGRWYKISVGYVF
ncbi:MAG: TonB-dependent receptor plug domain-containing protein [Candidatus Omnitrophota bacterium]|nr:MAG: TonB-dependent receptor plug domain-containing protein [Candidatus Omnitrophota bacterium]